MSPPDGDRKRLILVGGGAPFLKVVRDALALEQLKVVRVFVPPAEIEFFRREVARGSAGRFDSVERIERGRFRNDAWPEGIDLLISFNNMSLIDDAAVQGTRRGGINYHAGRLPEYAGSYTYQWAIRRNERQFAATLHWMEGKVDSGPIIREQLIPIAPDEIASSLLVKTHAAAAALMHDVLVEIAVGRALPRCPQDLSRRRFHSLRSIRSAGTIDWNRSGEEIERQIRAADFGPLPSPTYVPVSPSPRGPLQVYRAAAGPGTEEGRPGTILAVDRDGIKVRTGKGPSLLLTSISLDGRRFAPPHLIAAGLQAGDILEERV